MKFVVFCILFSSLGVAGFAYLPFTQSMSAVNLKDAGEFLDSLEGEAAEIVTLQREGQMINPSAFVPILDVYTHKKIRYHEGAHVSPGREERETSPLRFTWEYRNPDYYHGDKDLLQGHNPVVVIAGEEAEILPASVAQKIRGLASIKVFTVDEGVFFQKTFVTVYAPENGFRNGPRGGNK